MREIAVYRPGRSFPAVSVTGNECQLMCDHCAGRYLKGMIAVRSPEELVQMAEKLHGNGGQGFLLSGGCDGHGHVPIDGYLAAVAYIKERTDLKINIHPGLVDAERSVQIKRSHADVVSMDLVMDPITITKDMHLSKSPDHFRRSLEDLIDAGNKVVPHVLLGLSAQKYELEAMDLCAEHGVRTLILLYLLHGTKQGWEDYIAGSVRYATKAGMGAIIGCMRPRSPRMEMKCLEAGAVGIANPSADTIVNIEDRGWGIKMKRECCALHL